MLRSHLITALRNLRRRKGYAFLNISGLAIGLAACLVVGLYVHHEFSYDEFHRKGDRIFRLNMKIGQLGASSRGGAEGAKAIASRFPEVVNYVRLFPSKEVIVSGQEPVVEEALYYADSSFFQIFTFPLQKGNPSTALDNPNSVVLTQKAAERYFPHGEAMGRTLRLRDGTVLRVTGIAENPPSNSHLKFDVLISFSTLPPDQSAESAGWGYQSHSYFLLTQASAARTLEAKLGEHLSTETDSGMEKAENWLGFAIRGMEFGLQPIDAIHLQPDFGGMIQPANDVQMLYAFGFIALFILLLACINYINFSTARAAKRSKEVGVRKAVGAGRLQLIRQFLGETLLLTLGAVLLALLMARLLLPAFSGLMGVELSFPSPGDVRFLGVVFGLTVLVGLIAGSYPALVLSRFRSAEVLKGASTKRMGGAALRKSLVVFQFAISMVIVVGALVAHNQLQYMQDKPLGYDTSTIVSIPLEEPVLEKAQTLKAEVLRVPGIVSASLAQGTPIRYMKSDVEFEGETVTMTSTAGDADYLRTMGMTLVAGSGFSTATESDSVKAVVVNETAARIFNLYDDVGATPPVDLAYGKQRLVGIVSDFHSATLHQPIGPVAIFSRPSLYRSLILRIDPSSTSSALVGARQAWQQVTADMPFNYRFLDARLAELYRSEARMAQLSTTFALLAVLIACFGLFGLVAFAAENRTKEIGIRKVLGATVPGIIGMFAKDFLKLVVAASLVAAPVAYFLMQRWLEDFAYRIDLGPKLFIAAGLAMILIALATVSYQAARAALANPVKSLQSE